MTDADSLEAEVKRAMIPQAGESTLLVDQSKLSARGLVAITPVSEISTVLGVGLSVTEATTLRNHGAKLQLASLESEVAS